MTTMREEGIVHLWDCDVYVASKALYSTEEDFVRALFTSSQQELYELKLLVLGYYPKDLLPHVLTSYMVHRIQEEGISDEPFWSQVDEPGRGHVPCWTIDMVDVWETPRLVMQRMTGLNQTRRNT